MQRHAGPNIDSLEAGHTVGVLIDTDMSLHLYVDGADVGIVARDIGTVRYHGVVDLYGQCEQVSLAVVDGETACHDAELFAREHREKADKEEGLYSAFVTNFVIRAGKLSTILSQCNAFRMVSRLIVE